MIQCVFCKEAHLSSRCRKITDINARYEIVRRENRCFVCLKQSHRAKYCHLKFYSCVICQRKHNIALCDRTNDNPPRSNGSSDRRTVYNSVAHTDSQDQVQPSNNTGILSSTTNISVGSDLYETKEILLQCAMGDVRSIDDNKTYKTCLLFDGCSQRTYVTAELQERLKLQCIRTEKIFLKTFSVKEGRLQTMDVVQLCVMGRNGVNVYLEALVVPFICSSLKFPSSRWIKDRYVYLRDLDLATPPTKDCRVDFLVGMDYYFSIVSGRILRGPPHQPVGVDSILGWMVCGPTEVVAKGNGETLVQMIEIDDICQDLETSNLNGKLQKFWELESVVDSDEKMVLKGFQDSIEFNGSRYVAELSLQDPNGFSADHNTIALKRLLSLHANLFKDTDLRDEYYKVFKEYENEGIIEKVCDPGVPGKVNYLPHRPVVRTDKETSKVRPVFDASAHERGGKSLNDHLHTGPSLLRQIFDIIIRARFKKVIIIADIRQAFLNIEISDKHKDLLRFLLLDEENPSQVLVYRFNRGCFGVNCLPFILCATIIHHMNTLKINEKEANKLIDQFLRDLYMDDVTTAVNNVEEGIIFYDFARKALADAGLDLRKWDSNSPELRKYMNSADDGKDIKKLLGVSWNKNDDFVFDFSEMVEEGSKVTVTKRHILSFGAKFFDPSGWISPIIAVARMYFQKCCKKKYGWDEEVQEDIKEGWLRYIQRLREIKCIYVPRYLFSAQLGLVNSVELHGYCDSSEQAYSAVIYAYPVTNEGSQSSSRIVASKSKVTPIKKTSIPRLELLACVLLSELMGNVCKVLKDTVVVDKIRYWSDSEVALAWIKGGEKWSPWVQSRVKKVKKKSAPDHWDYVHTSINPADIGTRESSAMKIDTDERWWYGPSLPHSNVVNVSKMGSISEVGKEKLVATLVIDFDPSYCIRNLIDVERYNSLQKLLRVTANVLKFVDATKGKRKLGDISSEDTERAMKLWIKTEQGDISRQKKFANLEKQLSLFRDEEGILRLKGRLDNSHLSYDAKHPILLNKDSYFTTLVIRHAHHKVKHMRMKSTLNEIRQRFWICSGKRTVNSAIKGCVSMSLVKR